MDEYDNDDLGGMTVIVFGLFALSGAVAGAFLMYLVYWVF